MFTKVDIPILNKKLSIVVNGKLIDFSQTKVMAILNITPDSFYDGGLYQSHDLIMNRVDDIIEQGADIIDIGAVSSRPGANHVSVSEERNRLLPVVELIRKRYPDITISIDTYRSDIVKDIVEHYGQILINDISAGNLDNRLFETVSRYNLPYILMHMQGNPQTMQLKPSYTDVTNEILKFFIGKIKRLRDLGIYDIIIDPGFGFGKSIEDNYAILARLDEFKILELPVLVGISRKSMIYRLLNITPEKALNATALLHGLAIERGANILRVHDVSEAVQNIKLMNKFNEVEIK